MTRKAPKRDTSHPRPPQRSPAGITNYPQKGWFQVGHTRMIFFDVLQGFYNLRKVIKEEVGDNASYLIFQAGIKGGFSFLEPMIQKSRFRDPWEWFVQGLSAFTDGGAGNFEIKDLDWGQGWARVTCENSFEGWTYAQRKELPGVASCDYSRGIILGFMQATHKYAGTGLEESLDCVEVTCLALGDANCEFLVGSREKINEQGYEPSRPGKSIQEQLKERVWEKTKEIREVNHFNENIIQSMTDGIMVLDRGLRIKTWNRQMERIFHVPSEKAMGKRLDELARSMKYPYPVEHLTEGMKSGRHCEEKGIHLRSRGRETMILNLKVIPLFDEGEAGSGFIVLHEDITEKEGMEIRYRNLFETAQDGICLTDLNGRVISANKKIMMLLETPWEELEGKSLVRFVSPHHKKGLEERVLQVTSGLEAEPHEVEIKSRSGRTTPVEMCVSAVREGEKVFGIHIISRDITVRKKLEEQMIRAGKLAAVGELASGVAHEINNPLASVLGYAEELIDLIQGNRSAAPGEVDELVEYLDTIMEQAHRCKDITQNLLNFARQGDSQLVFTDVNHILEKAVLLLEPDARRSRVKISKNLATTLPLVETDPSQLQQVFLNILKNAIDASRPGQSVAVETESGRGLLRVNFRDEGTGISEHHLKRIFDPFFTTKPPGRGTGLGLSICHGIVEKLMGTILVESALGKGTTFTVEISERKPTSGQGL